VPIGTSPGAKAIMKTLRRLAVASIALFAICGHTSVEAQTFDQVISFGDSLSDIGNLSSRTYVNTGGALSVPFAPPYFATLADPGSPTSLTNPPLVRFSNGPIWVEHLASNLNLPLTNHAFGGSRVGDAITPTFDLGAATGATPNVVVTDNLTKQTSDYLGNGLASGSTVYTFLSGANDFAFDLTSLTTDPTTFVTNTVGNLAGAIGQVAGSEAAANNGKDVFLVGNLPDLGNVPLTKLGIQQLILADPQAAAAGEAALLAGVTQVVDAFNAALVGALLGPGGVAEQTGAEIKIVDLHGLFDTALLPSNPFNLTNTTDPFFTTTGTGLADGPQSDPTANPLTDLPGYLFFDVQHPTAGVHEILGDTATRLVPEPASLTILSLAALALRRRR